jgi:hypothetical protein
MKTYLTVMHTSEGARPSEVRDRLLGLGFQVIKGKHDFVFDWGKDIDINEILWFADRVSTALKDMGIIFSFETI